MAVRGHPALRLVLRQTLRGYGGDTQKIRQFSGVGTSLVYEEYGDPQKVVVQRETNIPGLKEDQVLVRMLAAPVNPADINTIQGVYAVKPQLPSVPGNEGVGEVLEVGKNVESELQPGDRVIPRVNALGTWQTHALAASSDVIKIPSGVDLVTAATIAVNPSTAYRMLKDFVPVKRGDTVIQNGANSAVGQAVIQIAAALGMKTVNVVRDRTSIRELKEHLTGLGATVVVTEAELRKSEEVKALPPPRLALNCVSGRSGTEILRQLTPQGVMVTYGGMSRQPVTAPVGALIFNDVTLRGFWMTRWNKEHFSHPERLHMLDELFQLAQGGQLRPPDHTLVPFSNFQEALKNAMPSEGMLGKKQILIF
ncbi:enoyl-[acyl-carrier-protein] reductase, mitochondrial-like [Homarus americanus]|uniref:Enoyl-[acyl-carrier-protein] reductase, mitochondrial n=1 Tax=Homarus americanus TaxID=6706 RepID=A0A8J5N809_HOMAM|nr:enoyl-[acyl-carrier-protein] reductase, mitochondrial-like [Homarus americanus]KAG7175521.1 Enoyl-[acyl-carrier-protein] reductase-like 1 [Homarus americanus]